MEKLRRACLYFIMMFLCWLTNLAWCDVINNSDNTVFVKEENSPKLVELSSGQRFKGAQDGIVVEGKVFKNSDGIDLVVGEKAVVSIMQKNPITRAIEKIRAGELKESSDPARDPAFKKAQEQRSRKADKERKDKDTLSGVDING